MSLVMRFELRNKDCIDFLNELDDNSVDSMVTDPPAGIAFQGLEWDKDKGGRESWVKWMTDVMSVAYKKLKPGSHGFVWSIPRTEHWTAWALENSGFDIIDKIVHIFATGFPTSHNISMSIDKHLKIPRDKVRIPANEIRNPKSINGGHGIEGGDRPYMRTAQEVGWHDMTSPVPVSDEAKKWDGWGTRLKPSYEVYILVRKPVEGTVAGNVLKYNTGGLNISDCRIGSEEVGWHGARGFKNTHNASKYGGMGEGEPRPVVGRWPSHLICSHSEHCEDDCTDDCPVDMLDMQNKNMSRYLYCPKPSRREKDEGLGDFELRNMNRLNSGGMSNDPKWSGRMVKNTHNTVKPVELMRYLIRLITPPNGLVMDMFCGSGTTGVACMKEGMRFIGGDENSYYIDISRGRMMSASSDD